MSHALQFHFDPEADQAVRQLWHRLEKAKISSLATTTHRRHHPHVTFAAATTIPAGARKSLRDNISRLAIPSLWLHSLGAFSSPEPVLYLGAVVDAELLAVHSAVHDALAGKVKNPSAYHLPGSWTPHIPLARNIEPAQLAKGFTALYPVEPVRARLVSANIVDTHTGETTELLRLD
ncbi:2'-5' RNA ligase superfamily protein [Herbihabitans rhizosphaerae]|uniref:2'-5' RNA ligase superfamily protein n=1 Tax=Herbihabitans rhizosphaerae TaxID=1872711 RepID=A0A4Q7KZM1_9PSEU|nr:2'-5' RNA ligase family protein [Herbihabitans rhizosphaerae]RZS41172.1 2'-5' RNA ligase superfamily protein [Herbihabitans rhizosphaerae]